jgi:hypothetical protein
MGYENDISLISEFLDHDMFVASKDARGIDENNEEIDKETDRQELENIEQNRDDGHIGEKHDTNNESSSDSNDVRRISRPDNIKIEPDPIVEQLKQMREIEEDKTDLGLLDEKLGNLDRKIPPAPAIMFQPQLPQIAQLERKDIDLSGYRCLREKDGKIILKNKSMFSKVDLEKDLKSIFLLHGKEYNDQEMGKKTKGVLSDVLRGEIGCGVPELKGLPPKEKSDIFLEGFDDWEKKIEEKKIVEAQQKQTEKPKQQVSGMMLYGAYCLHTFHKCVAGITEFLINPYVKDVGIKFEGCCADIDNRKEALFPIYDRLIKKHVTIQKLMTPEAEILMATTETFLRCIKPIKEENASITQN